MNFYDSFLRLCNSIGKSPSGVALEIGISKPTVNRWKNGSTPTDATAQKVADYFGVSVEEMKGSSPTQQATMAAIFATASTETQKKPADPKVDRLSKAGYEELTPENKAVIDSLIEKLLKSQAGE